MSEVCAAHPHLRRNYTNSVFAGLTINLGPQTVTQKHTDALNIPFGWCVITALGNYDHKRGGHLVLWDLKMIIEFPPGSTIFIPSACISHSNVKIADNECRYSMTQYTAGGIMRWVACGLQSHAALQRAGGQLLKDATAIWNEGVNLLSTWSELKAEFNL